MIDLLRRFMSPYKGSLALVVALQFVQAIANMYLPELNAEIVNNGVVRGDVDFILGKGVVMVLATLVFAGTAVVAAYWAARVAMAFGRDVRSAVFRHVQTLSQVEVNHFGTATLITRNTNDVQQVQMVAVMGLTMMISAPILAVGGAIMALRQDVPLSALILVIIPAMGIVIGLIASRAVPMFQAMQLKTDRINLVVREVLSGIRIVRAFVRTRHEEARFEDANADLTATALRVNRLQQAAGIRTEPPVSVPRATSASPVATATAEPLDEPPGSRPGSSGFGGVPSQEFTPLADQHSSVRLVLPTIRAPARRAAATTGASRPAGPACSAIARQPAVVGRPSMSMQSLTASRGPPPGASSRITQMESMRVNCHGSFAWKSRRLRCPDRLVSHRVSMRVAIITESFPPDVNGVAHTVLRVAELLASYGHHPLVVAPRPPREKRPAGKKEEDSYPFPVVRVPAVPLPGYPGFRLGLPGRKVRAALVRHRADVVHLASPVFLGAHGAAVARRLGLPTVAVYQTDLPSYARAYRLGRAGQAFAWRWLRGIHNGAARTLAPSTVTATGLLGQGIGNVWLWGRGVDTRRFDPARRSQELRAQLAPGGEVIAGYVGRLATEKRVELLAGITALPGVRLVIVGAGPAEAMLRQQLPGAAFLGERRGEELAAIYASLDVFVHSGPYETFGQTLQEAAASGLPVVAPAAGGPLDLVADGVTGYLVPPSDPDAFTAAVARLAADPAARAAFGAAGRRKVLGRSWAALTEELIGHYSQVLGTGKRAKVAL